MNRQETSKLLAILNVAYPRFEVKPDQVALTVELWQKSFEDIPFPVVEAAVQKLLLESEYPPTIAAVAQRIAEVNSPTLTAAEAWGEVVEAERKYGYYRQEEAMNSLSALTRKVVEQIGFVNWCISKNVDTENTLRAQFRMAYQTMADRAKNDALLPERLKLMIAQVGVKQIGGSL